MRDLPLKAMTAFLPLLLFALSPAASAQQAPDRTLSLLQRLSDAPGPPGFEEPVRKIMLEAMKPYVGSIKYDGLGSIIATQGTTGPRIMVDAHLDELGGVESMI